MKRDHKKIVRSTWKIIMGIDPKIVGDAFYSKLFNDYPGLKKLFPPDMNEQYVKLTDMISAIVMTLDNPENTYDDIVAMAKRHTNYGVKPAHFNMVGESLLWTLKRGLGTDWNKETEDAWIACYAQISEIMLKNCD